MCMLLVASSLFELLLAQQVISLLGGIAGSGAKDPSSHMPCPGNPLTQGELTLILDITSSLILFVPQKTLHHQISLIFEPIVRVSAARFGSYSIGTIFTALTTRLINAKLVTRANPKMSHYQMYRIGAAHLCGPDYPFPCCRSKYGSFVL